MMTTRRSRRCCHFAASTSTVEYSLAEQSAGSTGAKVPFGKRFCINRERQFSPLYLENHRSSIERPRHSYSSGIDPKSSQSRSLGHPKGKGALTSERLAYFASSAILFKRRAIWRIAKSSKAYLCETRRAHLDKGSDICVTSMPAYLESSAGFARRLPHARRI